MERIWRVIIIFTLMNTEDWVLNHKKGNLVFKYLLFEGKRWIFLKNKILVEVSQFITWHVMEALSINFKVHFFFPKKRKVNPQVLDLLLVCHVNLKYLVLHLISSRIKITIVVPATSPELPREPDRTLYVKSLTVVLPFLSSLPPAPCAPTPTVNTPQVLYAWAFACPFPLCSPLSPSPLLSGHC